MGVSVSAHQSLVELQQAYIANVEDDAATRDDLKIFGE